MTDVKIFEIDPINLVEDPRHYRVCEAKGVCLTKPSKVEKPAAGVEKLVLLCWIDL